MTAIIYNCLEDVETPAGWDGVTFLPSESELREFGFTDHRPEQWYYVTRVSSSDSFNINIAKEPLGEVHGVPFYPFKELVIDEYFGQPAYFGQMIAGYRRSLTEKLINTLESLAKLGLQIRVDPRDYGWSDWPENSKLSGTALDKEVLATFGGDVEQ